MSSTDLRPVLRTPTGGAESQPQRPADWHGHPYIWAWNVSLGATSRSYIEGECKAAEDAGAPPEAVYRARPDDPSMPGEWVTVGMMVNAGAQQRVRDYAQALKDWQEALQAYSKPAASIAVKPEHEYTVVFRPTHITGVVRARNFLEACQKLAPGERFKPSGYGVLDFQGDHGVQWHVGFDSGRGEILSTTDDQVRPQKSPPAAPPTAEAPAAPEPSQAPVAAEDTAATRTPTPGSGVKVLRRKPQS